MLFGGHLGIQDGRYIFACFLKQVSKQVERSLMLTEYVKIPINLIVYDVNFLSSATIDDKERK
jgi:hypothetical protein